MIHIANNIIQRPDAKPEDLIVYATLCGRMVTEESVDIWLSKVTCPECRFKNLTRLRFVDFIYVEAT